MSSGRNFLDLRADRYGGRLLLHRHLNVTTAGSVCLNTALTAGSWRVAANVACFLSQGNAFLGAGPENGAYLAADSALTVDCAGSGDTYLHGLAASGSGVVTISKR